MQEFSDLERERCLGAFRTIVAFGKSFLKHTKVIEFLFCNFKMMTSLSYSKADFDSCGYDITTSHFVSSKRFCKMEVVVSLFECFN